MDYNNQLTPEFWDNWHASKGLLAVAIPEMADYEIIDQIQRLHQYKLAHYETLDESSRSEIDLYHRRLWRHMRDRGIEPPYMRTRGN